MIQVFFILGLLATVVVAHLINRHAPMVPLPVILIALGIAMSLLPVFHDFFFDPTLFILAVVAPLLYNEA